MKHVYTSSGIIKNADKPRVGIISQHSVDSELLNEIIMHGVDLSYEAFLKELESQELDEEQIQEACDNYQNEGSVYLYGDWACIDGKYSIHKEGKFGYALTYNTESGNLCVEYSNTVKRCNNTSPCYVMADGSGPCGDLDTDGDIVVAYALPDDCLHVNEG
jgi:hypothetical protein